MVRHSFNPTKDIPSLAGKVVLVTGSNVGIGKQTALELSKHGPAEIWVAARNVDSGNQAVADIRAVSAPETTVKLLEIDLESFASVKSAARKVSAACNRLDILILNAGLMGGPATVSKDGYEKAFAVNHMGHALLLKLLTPLLLNASKDKMGTEPRVVILSSAAQAKGIFPEGGIDFSTLKTAQKEYGASKRYCQSKLANAVYAIAFAKHNPEFTTVPINPGEVKTELFSKGASGGGSWIISLLQHVVIPLMGVSVEEGAKNSLWAATSKDVKTGKFYDPVGKAGMESQRTKDEKLQEKLWEWTEKELQGQEL